MTDPTPVVADLLDAYRVREALRRWVADRRTRYPQSRVAGELARLLTTRPLPEEDQA